MIPALLPYSNSLSKDPLPCHKPLHCLPGPACCCTRTARAGTLPGSGSRCSPISSVRKPGSPRGQASCVIPGSRHLTLLGFMLQPDLASAEAWFTKKKADRLGTLVILTTNDEGASWLRLRHVIIDIPPPYSRPESGSCCACPPLSGTSRCSRSHASPTWPTRKPDSPGNWSAPIRR